MNAPMTFEELSVEYRQSVANAKHEVRQDLYHAITEFVNADHERLVKAVQNNEAEIIVSGLRERYSSSKKLARITVEARTHLVKLRGRNMAKGELTPEEEALAKRIHDLESEFIAEVLRI